MLRWWEGYRSEFEFTLKSLCCFSESKSFKYTRKYFENFALNSLLFKFASKFFKHFDLGSLLNSHLHHNIFQSFTPLQRDLLNSTTPRTTHIAYPVVKLYEYSWHISPGISHHKTVEFSSDKPALFQACYSIYKNAYDAKGIIANSVY